MRNGRTVGVSCIFTFTALHPYTSLSAALGMPTQRETSKTKTEKKPGHETTFIEVCEKRSRSLFLILVSLILTCVFLSKIQFPYFPLLLSHSSQDNSIVVL